MKYGLFDLCERGLDGLLESIGGDSRTGYGVDRVDLLGRGAADELRGQLVDRKRANAGCLGVLDDLNGGDGAVLYGHAR